MKMATLARADDGNHPTVATVAFASTEGARRRFWRQSGATVVASNP